MAAVEKCNSETRLACGEIGLDSVTLKASIFFRLRRILPGVPKRNGSGEVSM